MAIQHDRFGNPILGTIDNIGLKVIEVLDGYGGGYGAPTNAEESAIAEAIVDRYRFYGINSAFYDFDDHTDDEKISSWMELLSARWTIVWNRYARVASAYEEELSDIDKASQTEQSNSDTSSKTFGKGNLQTRNLTDETQNMTTANSGENDTTDYDLPNKSVSKPYGNPTQYSKDTNSSTSTINGKVLGTGTLQSQDSGSESNSGSGTKVTKASQLEARANYIREMKRNLFNDIAEDLKPCFCGLYL